MKVKQKSYVGEGEKEKKSENAKNEEETVKWKRKSAVKAHLYFSTIMECVCKLPHQQ